MWLTQFFLLPLALLISSEFFYETQGAPFARREVTHNQTIHDLCLLDAGVTNEQVEKYEKDDVASEDLNCYYLCLFTQADYLTEGGAVVLDKFKEDPTMGDVDLDCLENAPRMMECNDIKYLEDCNI